MTLIIIITLCCVLLSVSDGEEDTNECWDKQCDGEQYIVPGAEGVDLPSVDAVFPHLPETEGLGSFDSPTAWYSTFLVKVKVQINGIIRF